MVNRIRNQYNNDRLMWLGAFAPGLRSLGPPIQEKEKLSSGNPQPRQGPLSFTMQAQAVSNMDTDQKVKFFINGSQVPPPELGDWNTYPVIVDNDLLTVWVYAPTEELPAQAKLTLTFLPDITGPSASFPGTMAVNFYGYVNGLEVVSNTPVGNPVAEGATPGSYGVILSLDTEKLLARDEQELGQMVFSVTASDGEVTQVSYRIQVVMCEKIERYQAVQHDGTAGGPFLWDWKDMRDTYDNSVVSNIIATSGQYPILYSYQDKTGLVLPVPATSTDSTVTGPAISMTYNFPLIGSIPDMPTDTFKGKDNYAAALNLPLGSLTETLLATGSYTSPYSAPGTIFTIPSYNIDVTSQGPIRFDSSFTEFLVQDLPNPTTDPEAIYQEILVQSIVRVSTYTTVFNASASYIWPPIPARYLVTPEERFNGPAIIGPNNGTWGADLPHRGTARAIIYAPTYKLSQYVDPEITEANPQPGKAVYLMLTATVQMSDEEYAALRAAGVQSLEDFEQFIQDNPSVGEIQTLTEFSLDLNTSQMQNILGTGQDLDDAEAEALFKRLASDLVPTEDFLNIPGNKLDYKITPPSPSNMDKLKMAGKVVSGVNSLVTLGKIAANIGVLQSPLGILMLINTGINIYNGAQAAGGLIDNKNPQYIPTVNETFFNAFKELVSPTPARPRGPVILPAPRRIP